jgi:hypothetical protein
MSVVRFLMWKNFSLGCIVQPSAKVHAASCPVGNGVISQGQSGSGGKPTSYLYLVPRNQCLEFYLHSVKCLHGVVLIEAGGMNLFIYIFFTIICLGERIRRLISVSCKIEIMLDLYKPKPNSLRDIKCKIVIAYELKLTEVWFWCSRNRHILHAKSILKCDCRFSSPRLLYRFRILFCMWCIKENVF